MPLRTVRATRYVTPLREGGSMPAVIEADDDGMYVLKFRGAGRAEAMTRPQNAHSDAAGSNATRQFGQRGRGGVTGVGVTSASGSEPATPTKSIRDSPH